jgi:DNA primase
MAAHLKDARPLADMLFMRETDERSFDTPEQRAALERSLGEAVGKIADEPLRRHYQADVKRRLSTFFGDDRERPARGYSNAKQAFVPKRGGPLPQRGPRMGVAEAPLAPQSKLGRSARLPAREIMILSIALGHPALIEGHFEELAATEFMGAGVNALRDALLAAPADALMSSTTLAEWLNGAGRGPDRERILDAAAKMPNWWCMRPEAAPSDADLVLRQSLALHRRAGALHRDLKLAEQLLATEPNELNLARLLDIKANLADLADGEAAIDGFGDQSGRISSAI